MDNCEHKHTVWVEEFLPDNPVDPKNPKDNEMKVVDSYDLCLDCRLIKHENEMEWKQKI